MEKYLLQFDDRINALNIYDLDKLGKIGFKSRIELDVESQDLGLFNNKARLLIFDSKTFDLIS